MLQGLVALVLLTSARAYNDELAVSKWSPRYLYGARMSPIVYSSRNYPSRVSATRLKSFLVKKRELYFDFFDILVIWAFLVLLENILTFLDTFGLFGHLKTLLDNF